MTPAAVAAGLDLAGYFDRVQYRGKTEPTLQTLAAVVAAHNRCIPFAPGALAKSRP